MYANEEAVPFRGNSLFICAYFISTFYPLLLGILQRAVGGFVLTQDLFLSALFGGLCIGISLALIIRLGASLYGIILVIVYTMTLDRLLALGTAKTKLEIVTRHSEAMKDAILADIDRGVTGRGFTKEKKYIPKNS